MPVIHSGGLRHYYRVDGRADRPTLIFSHSLGCDHTQWDDQALALQTHFQVIRYDIRGHGATDVPSGDYTLESLGRDVLAIADALGVEQFAWCGLSLGGMIGQWLGVNAPERVTHLVLANTSPRTDATLMEARRKNVLENGMASIEDAVMHRFFCNDHLASGSPSVPRTRRVLLATNPVGYAGCCAAIRDMDQTASIAAIRTPTLIIAGDRDVSTPWSGHGDVIARAVPHARVVHLPTAHLSNLETPRAFNAALTQFLIPAANDALESGFQKRRQVLGNEHVDRMIASTTGFTRAFQEMITRYAWDAVWQRPGLDDRTRRLLAFSVTAALGRWEEFRAHVRAALDHRTEPCDIEETLLQLAIYAGVPAANTAFKIASEEIARETKEPAK